MDKSSSEHVRTIRDAAHVHTYADSAIKQLSNQIQRESTDITESNTLHADGSTRTRSGRFVLGLWSEGLSRQRDAVLVYATQ